MKFAGLASVKEIRTNAVIAGLKPPPRLSLSQWADEHVRLSAESAAVPGRWKTLPYQVGIMDAMSDPTVTDVTLMKSARIGYTLMISAAVGYFVHQQPCSILFAQPTVDDAKEFSKDTIAPMMIDVPVLAEVVQDEAEEKGPRGADTIRGKRYPGGRLSLIGANSGAGFRRRSCRVFIGDEVDAWPASAGNDGDPVRLGKKRTEYFWNRKHFFGSTPLIEGHSRIQKSYLEGDQRKFYVPCPHCGHMDHLVFKQDPEGGHYLVFDKTAPDDAHFVCSQNGCVIEYKDQRAMVAGGEWRAAQPFNGHASFHIWAAYSFSPNATWAHIVKEFLAANAAGPEELQTFINTTLGATWKQVGEAPNWEPLYRRRETYPIGSVPDRVQWLTTGVDVQKDRFVYEVVGWAANRESWSIDAGVIPARTEIEADWSKLDELLGRIYETAAGPMTTKLLAVDAGYNTQMVYLWARRHIGPVIAVKGSATERTLHGTPKDVDINHNGQRITRGCKLWPVGVDIAKAELYGWLRMDPPLEAGTPYPVGFCHFPEHGEDFFKQLTGEHLVSTKDRRGFPVHEWQKIPGRENHYLDCRVYARAAVSVLGLDRVKLPPSAAVPGAAPAVARAAPAKPKRQIPDSNFLKGRAKGGWLKR